MTSQPKLRLNRRGDSTRNYRYEERQHKYDMHPEQPRSVTLASSTKKKVKKGASSRLMKKAKSNRRPTGRDARIQH
ncbi:hypothetical protein D3C87_1960730 [compost metagenome]